jgi:hypothetical protein
VATQSDARHELLQKSRSAIEEETAFKWAARAVAAYRLFVETQSRPWLLDAVDYAHEAVEHAALADRTGQVLQSVREYVHRDIPHDVA